MVPLFRRVVGKGVCAQLRLRATSATPFRRSRKFRIPPSGISLLYVLRVLCAFASTPLRLP